MSCRVGCGSSKFEDECNNAANYSKQRIWGIAADRLMGKPEFGRFKKNSFVISRPPFARQQIIYRGCEGLAPYYTGHVPGEQFRIGKTFTASSRKAELVVRPQYYYPNC